MVEPENNDYNKTTNLEDTVRNLREENAKLLQLLRSQGLLLDHPNGQSNDSLFSTANSSINPTQITLNHSDLSLTNNSLNTTNQINHQQITNHVSTNQQNFTEQTIHGNQSNITPNFNTVIQSTTQPFVQNNSNTLVQNNTNLIQPINLVNINNVSLDSIHSFLASQNNLVYFSQTSSSATTTTTTTTTSSLNANLNESIPSNTQSILSSSEHQVSIRPKPSILHPHQELVPVIPKMKTELYESYAKQFSSSTSNNDTTNLLDNDSNDPKQKYPRPIRPKPSTRGHGLQSYKSVMVHETRSASLLKNSSSSVSLLSNSNYSPSSINNYQSQSSNEHSTSQLIHSKSLDLSIPSTVNKKSTKNRLRNRKKPISSISSTTIPLNNQTLVPIAPNLGRPLAPAPANLLRTVTSNNPITKRSQKKIVKRNSKSLVQHHSESILPQKSSSPSNSFAESISGLLENFDQELMASNFIPQATVTTPTITTSNLLSDQNNSLISTNTNIIQTFNHVDQTTIEPQESYNSISTINEFNPRLETETILTQTTTQDFNVENEPITSFMSEEDMRIVEMNFDENTFLKQFDLDDAGIKFNVHSDQNLFANLLTTNNDLISTQLPQQQLQNDMPTLSSNLPPPSIYPGSSLINNNVFTTVVPLGSQHQQQQTAQGYSLITNSNVTRLLPEEGVQLTARHIEPSQVATYESVKYQDILDDLVMVTDQDALRHAQATAESDPSIVASEFSFALLEATNEIIKNTNLEMVDENTTALTELQYFYPIESENCPNKQQEIQPEQQEQPIVILDKLQSQLISTNTNTLDDSVINTSITDLSSILQFQSIQSPTHQDMSTTELITPIRPTNTISTKSLDQSIDFESLLSSSSSSPSSSKLANSHSNDPTQTCSQISDTLVLSSNSLEQQSQSTETMMSPRPCILFEPISSSSNPSSPMKSSQNEMIIDSGRLDNSNSENINLINHDEQIEELLRDSTNNPYEIIENHGQTCMKNHVVTTDVNQLIEQIEPSETDPKRTELLEQTFSRYQQKYQLNIQRQQKVSSKNSQEQSLIIPPVKLKLNSIFSQQTLKMKEEQKSPSSSPPPAPPCDDQIEDQPPPPPPVERPPLKITIRTKLPTSIPSPKQKTPNKKNRKSKKKKSHHYHHHNQNSKKAKIIADQLETEYAGLTRFERPLAQLYHQQSPPTSDETLPKDENIISSLPPPPVSRSESQSSSTLHTGFMIDEQTPPSSITSNEHKQSPPPLLLTQTKSEKVKQNYSHIFNYDNHHEHQNNDTFVTPPPEIDLHPHHHQQQQKHHSYDNFCTFPNSPNKQRHQQRKSSVTSSSSSRSITNTDYAIDTQALEPVSPTPISTSKPKHSRNSSASSTNYNDVSPSYFEHQQTRQTKDYHLKKSSSSSSSSSNRTSRPTSSSQMYPQSRSLTHHTYRPSQEPPPLLPSMLPPPSSALHLDPYTQSYHHPFAPRAAPPTFFNFPFPHPFLNPHSTTTSSHYHPHSHHHSMKYSHHHHHPHPHHHHHHSSHAYPTHQQQYSYHSHLPRQPHYNNSNYMSSRDHHSFDR